MSQETDLWDRNEIQYPWLLSEVFAVLKISQLFEIATSMDLENTQVTSLFERAKHEWKFIRASL